MLVSIVLIGLLVAASAGVSAAARFLGRPLPRPILAAFVLLSVLPYPSAYVRDVTPLPLDHVMNTRPWFEAGVAPAHNPNLNDISIQFLPWTEAVKLAWKEGALPLRDRWSGCGTPLAANGVSAAFWPLTFLALLLPMARGFTLIGSIKLLLAACGMWLWTRELGTQRPAAGFGAVSFSLSFLFAPWIFYPQSSVFCLWPWTLFLLERLRDGGHRRRVVGALTAVFVLTVLAGHSESTAVGFVFMALFLVGRRLARDLPDALPVARAIALAALIALGLTAFLVIPSLFAIAASGRLDIVARPYWEDTLSLWPHGPYWTGILTAFFPHTMGNAMRAPTLPGGTGSFPEMTMGYVGILGWSAALLVFRRGSRRKPVEIVLWLLLLCGFGAAVGQWPFAEILARVPGLRYVFPLRFNGWVALAAPAIAALELQRYADDVRDRRSSSPVAAVLFPAALALSGIALYAYLFALRRSSGGLRFQTWQLATVLTVLGLAALAALLARGRPDVFIGALTLLCGFELLWQWNVINRVYDTALFFPDRPLLQFLRAQPGSFRVVGERFVLFPNTNVFARLEDIRTHDAVERRDYVRFLDSTCGYPHADYFKTLRNVDAPALDFLNVRFALAGPGGRAPGARWRPVYSGEDGTVFENSTVLPRAFAPGRVRFVRGVPAARTPVLDAARAFGAAWPEVTAIKDWRGIAYVLATEDAEAENPAVEISDYRELTNAASFRARVADGSRPGWVVLSLVQDGGWSAADETGETIPAHLANGPFLALRIPPGDRSIRLRYSPPGFRIGAILSLATLAIWAGLIAIGALRGRRRAAASGGGSPPRLEAPEAGR